MLGIWRIGVVLQENERRKSWGSVGSSPFFLFLPTQGIRNYPSSNRRHHGQPISFSIFLLISGTWIGFLWTGLNTLWSLDFTVEQDLNFQAKRRNGPQKKKNCLCSSFTAVNSIGSRIFVQQILILQKDFDIKCLHAFFILFYFFVGDSA